MLKKFTKHKFIQTTILFSSILFSYSCKKDLTCKDFRKGNFYIPSKYEVKSVFIVNRQNKTQKETNYDSLNNIVIKYETINWLTDCSYRLLYDSTKTNLNETEKWINRNNGIIVEKIKIVGKCMDYKATMHLKDGKELNQTGSICKK